MIPMIPMILMMPIILSPLPYLSLQMHSPSPSQMPLVWPRVTQLAEHAHSPREHLEDTGVSVADRDRWETYLNPASAGAVRPSRRTRAEKVFMVAEEED